VHRPTTARAAAHGRDVRPDVPRFVRIPAPFQYRCRDVSAPPLPRSLRGGLGNDDTQLRSARDGEPGAGRLTELVAAAATWLWLVDDLDRIDDAERLPGRLGTTMRQECLHILRRTGREESSTARPWLLDTVPDPDRPLDAGLPAEERDTALRRAIDTMGERCRRLLRVLMATPPPSYASVSETLGVPIGSIGPTRQRCLRRLREIVSQDATLRDRLGGSAGETAGRTTVNDDDDRPDGDRTDDELMERLRDVADELDPVPEAVLRDARTALSSRLLDHELAVLLGDSAMAGTAVRGGGPRLLSFRAGPVALELQLDEVGEQLSLRGQVTGAAGEVQVETATDRRRVPIDAEGWFVVPDLPTGAVRLRLVAVDGTAVSTSWVTV
jgi:DNA-directed RNA polymerase specialized sigma24 family protein